MSQTAPPDKPELKHNLNFQIVVFVLVRLAFNTTHRMIYPFLSYFAQGVGVDFRTFSYAILTRSLLGIFGPFLASVADSRGRKFGMLSGTAIYIAAVGMIVLWPTYTSFFISLSLSYIAYIIFIPSLQAYVGDKVPYEKRGRALGITEFAWSLSAIIGVPLVGLIIGKNGWMAPFPLFVLLGALSFFIISWMLPKDALAKDGQSGILNNLGKVFSYPTAVSALLMAALYTAANETISIVYSKWVEQDFALSIASLGATAMVIGISELGGEVLVIAFTDKIGKRKALGIGIIGNCLAVLALPVLGRWLAGAMICLFLIYLTYEFTLVSGIPLMTEILPTTRATMMAAHMSFIAIGRAMGDFLAPPLFTQSVVPGITAIALAAMVFNILALVFLSRIKLTQALPTS